MRWSMLWMLACSPGGPGGFVPGVEPGVLAIDGDGDGYYAAGPYGNDCDDADPSVHPGAPDLTCDGVDNDCYRGDGPDADGDLVTTCAGDCEDTNGSRAPGMPERCNGLDDDCDLAADEDFDQDSDGVFDCGPGFVPVPLQAGGGEFSPDQPSGAALVAFDLDHDGADEVASGGGGATPDGEPLHGGRVWLFHEGGDCLLCGLSSVEAEVITGLLAAGDINGDGFGDLLTVAADPFLPSSNTFLLMPGRAGPELGTPTRVWSDRLVVAAAALGDVTNDGYDDLAVVDPFGMVTLFGGSRTGLVEQRRLGSFPNLGQFVALEAADVTGDGLIDLVASTAVDFAGTQLWTLPWGESEAVVGGEAALDRSIGAAVEVATGGDLDGDGFGDVVYLLSEVSETTQLSTGTYAVARGAADGALTDTDWRLQVGDEVRATVITPDLDGDGLSDVATLRSAGDDLLLQAWTGWPAPALLSEARVPAAPPGLFSGADVAVGDLEGDGVLELVVTTGAALWVFRAAARDCDDHDALVTTACP